MEKRRISCGRAECYVGRSIEEALISSRYVSAKEVRRCGSSAEPMDSLRSQAAECGGRQMWERLTGWKVCEPLVTGLREAERISRNCFERGMMTRLDEEELLVYIPIHLSAVKPPLSARQARLL